MVPRTRLKSLPLVLTLLGLLVLSAACQVSQKGRKPSPDWSRSVPVGHFVDGGLDSLAAVDGSAIHLAWVQQDSEQPHIQYVRLDENAAPQLDRALDISADQLRRPLLELAAGSDLFIVWSSRIEGQRQWRLQASRLSPSGDLAGEVVTLVGPDEGVEQYHAAADGQGGLFIAWQAASDGALYGAQLSASGELIQKPVRLVDAGEDPFLVSDGTELYLSWWEQGRVYLGHFPGGHLAEIAGMDVAVRELADGQLMSGPVSGVAGEWAYVLWSVYSSSGLHAGTAVTEFVAFPKEAPIMGSAKQIFTSTAEEQTYVPFESAYQITGLALPVTVAESSDYVHEPDPAPGRGDELAVAVSLNQESRLNMLVQQGILLFKGGEFAGYQMAGRTEAFSQTPSLTSDGEGNLYIAWREGGQGSQAYYATTSAAGRQTLDKTSFGDITSAVLSSGVEIIVGMLFFPLAGIWIIPGFIIFGLWYMLRGDDHSDAELVVFMLLGIAAAEIVKFSFLPVVSSFVPFSAWMDISPRWQNILRYLVPIGTLAISLLVALLVRRRNQSPLVFFTAFLVTDALLTLAIYGVSFLGAM